MLHTTAEVDFRYYLDSGV